MKWNELEEIELDQVNGWDYPDMSDAYVASAMYNGRLITDSEADYINDTFTNEIQEMACQQVLDGP